VILAYRPMQEAERLVRNEELDRYTDFTRTTLDEIMADLRSVRERGYAVCDEEMEPGVAAVAAPIRDAMGSVVVVVA